MRKTRQMTAAAVLTAAALVMFIIEAQIPPLTSVPGIKLGLSNIVTVFTICTLGPGWAFGVLLVRIVLGSILTGQAGALLYSLSGGLLSYLILLLLYRRLPENQLWALSVLCAMCHNFGQILMAVWLLQTPQLWWYLPVLMISGIVAGAFTGLGAQLILVHMKKARISFFSEK